MTTAQHKFLALSVLLTLLYAVQVQSAPVPEAWNEAAQGLVHRARRSLLWRWNTLRPVGASCRDHAECGTNYCRRNVCSFRIFNS